MRWDEGGYRGVSAETFNVGISARGLSMTERVVAPESWLAAGRVPFVFVIVHLI